METITRNKAREQGLKFYFLGTECYYGHTTERYTSTGECKGCAKQRNKPKSADNYKNHPRKIALAKGDVHYFTGKACANGHIANRYTKTKVCVECKAEEDKKHYAKKEQRHKIYREENREKRNAKNKEYRLKYPERYRYHASLRRAKIKRAIPLWADTRKIKEIYFNCPEGHQVGHIVPLQGDNVCGLHVENNLQYLTVRENLQKGNKLMKEYTDL